MPLRFRITGHTVNLDGTLDVSYEIAWAKQAGDEVWKQAGTQRFSGAATRQQVHRTLQQIALDAIPQIQAMVDLGGDRGVTYEYDPNTGSWQAI